MIKNQTIYTNISQATDLGSAVIIAGCTLLALSLGWVLLSSQKPLIINNTYLDSLRTLTREDLIEHFKTIYSKLKNVSSRDSRIEKTRKEFLENVEELLKVQAEHDELIDLGSSALTESTRELTDWVDLVFNNLELLSGYL